MKNILVTGATGFVGSFAALTLSGDGHKVTAAVRRFVDLPLCTVVKVQDIDANTDWSVALSGCKIVVHTAACAHIDGKSTIDFSAQYRRVNIEGTLNLARQAAEAGVERFIFISSIGVNGSSSEKPFTEEDTPCPVGLYARSKWEAEQGLWEIQRELGFDLVIIRPPLVYGPDAPGNFGRLIRWIEKGIPLPLGAVNNYRSLIGIDNLVDLVSTCIEHPLAANQVFLAGDGADLSTTDLLLRVSISMGKPCRLIALPRCWLMFAANLFGKKSVAQRLLYSLQVDITKSRNLLGWEPPISVEEGLRRCFVKD